MVWVRAEGPKALSPGLQSSFLWAHLTFVGAKQKIVGAKAGNVGAKLSNVGATDSIQRTLLCPSKGHYCATSRHFVCIRFKKESITQIPFTLHLFLEIPCVYRGFRGWRVQVNPSSPFITLQLFAIFRFRFTTDRVVLMLLLSPAWVVYYDQSEPSIMPSPGLLLSPSLGFYDACYGFYGSAH